MHSGIVRSLREPTRQHSEKVERNDSESWSIRDVHVHTTTQYHQKTLQKRKNNLLKTKRILWEPGFCIKGEVRTHAPGQLCHWNAARQ